MIDKAKIDSYFKDKNIKELISEQEILEFVRNPFNWQKGIYYTEETLEKAVKLFIEHYGR